MHLRSGVATGGVGHLTLVLAGLGNCGTLGYCLFFGHHHPCD